MRKDDLAPLALSLVLQAALALFLGHRHDMRVFMAAGYLAASGMNPYYAHDLGEVFQHPLMEGEIPGIGYPPPAPLLFGVIYLMTYNLFPNIFLYSLALKVPAILSNVALAYLVRRILEGLAGEEAARRGWLFILFNPLILYTTSAWGQIDTLAALLALAALHKLSVGGILRSSALLGLSLSVKPISLPIAPLALLYARSGSPRQGFRYLAGLISAILVFSAAPFLLLGWSLRPVVEGWRAHSAVAGGMSPLTFVELLQGSYLLPEALSPLGLLWVPALAVGYFALGTFPRRSFEELLDRSLRITLVFFLTRAWLSEPNVNLVLPMMLILALVGRLSRRSLHLAWVLPLVFTVFNASIPQLLSLSYPDAMAFKEALDQRLFVPRILARTVTVIPWQVLGWSLVAGGLKKETP